ncbi:MAG: hypothetical protein WC547_11280, partial [Candidatus Omnitrophota bacterium]
FEQAGLRSVENTPEDIRDIVLEMLDRIGGNFRYTADDELLQERFKSLMGPEHYSYGAVSRIGRDFLKKYSELLEDTGSGL